MAIVTARYNVPMIQPNSEIVSEIYRTLVLLGAGSDLLGTIGSWGDSLSDADILCNLKAWNSATGQELTSRIEHYEILSRRPSRKCQSVKWHEGRVETKRS